MARAQNYNSYGKGVATGDFNFDGVVDFSDLVLLAQRYNTALPPPVLPASRLPVVATPLPEVARYDGLVYMADGRDAYLAQIEAALRESSSEAARRRVDAMRNEGWDARVEQISAIVNQHLETRTSRPSMVTA